MSTAKFDTWMNPNGTENYKCRAWVNFDGVTTATIRASGNVSSVTRNSTGNYTVNFTTAMPDANYAIAIQCGSIGAIRLTAGPDSFTPTASSVGLVTLNSGFSLADATFCNVIIFR
jgi:hypothetical protein